MANISQWSNTAGGNDTGSTPDFPVEGMAPSTVNDTMRENMAAVARWYQDTDGTLDSTGTGNSYVLSTNNGHSAVGDQSLLVFRSDKTNTGASTLNVDSLGAKAIEKNGGEALAAREIRQGQMVAVAYDSTDDSYKLVSEPAIQAGRMEMHGGSSEPAGWKFCNGQAISRTTFSDLFDEIGTTFGNGDGSTTFNVPDLRDRSPLGTASMGSSDAGRVSTTSTGLGDSGGADEHTLTGAEMPSHSHGGSTGNTAPRVRNETNNRRVARSAGGSSNRDQVALDGTNNADDSGEYFAESHNHSISTAGSDNAHNNMHPFLAINFVIKT